MKFKYFSLILSGLFLLSGCQLISRNFTQNPSSNNQDTNLSELDPASSSPLVNESVAPKPPVSSPQPKPDSILPKDNQNSETPNFLDYPVLFASQAPYGVWDPFHQEACEEASMIMADVYFNKKPLSSHLMEQAILDLVKWEEENNYQVDVSAEETVEILKEYFNLSAELTTEVTVEKIKKELALGKLVIVPAAGRELGNPYFHEPGPIYHMLVIRGYDEKNQEFITNDPGTKRGEGFRYQYKKMLSAVHDWNHDLAEGGMTDEEINQGRKVIIIVGPAESD